MNKTLYTLSDLNINGIIKTVLKEYVNENSWIIWFVFFICIDSILFACICLLLCKEIVKNREKTSQLINALQMQPSAPPWPEL